MRIVFANSKLLPDVGGVEIHALQLAAAPSEHVVKELYGRYTARIARSTRAHLLRMDLSELGRHRQEPLHESTRIALATIGLNNVFPPVGTARTEGRLMLAVLDERRDIVYTSIGVGSDRLPFEAQARVLSISEQGYWLGFNLNGRSVARLLDFLVTRRHNAAHYRRCHCPDQTFLDINLADDARLGIANRFRRHVFRKQRLYPPSPRTITSGPLLEAALNSGQPFVRKLDLDVNAGWLGKPDACIATGARRRTGTPA